MKKVSRAFSKSLDSRKIYRDDIVYIEDIIKNQLKFSGFKIIVDDYQFDSIDDIPEDTSPSSMVEIYGKSSGPQYNSLRVEVQKNYIWIYVSNSDSLDTKGAVNEIVQRLNQRRNIAIETVGKFSAFLAPILIGAMVGLSNIISRKDFLKSTSPIILLIALVLILLIITCGWWWAFKRTSKVYFEKKHTGFIKRNKDQITVGIIVSIITVILTLLVNATF